MIRLTEEGNESKVRKDEEIKGERTTEKKKKRKTKQSKDKDRREEHRLPLNGN